MTDLLRIIKNNRKFKIILKNSLMNKEIAEQMKHTEHYQINLDADFSSEGDNSKAIAVDPDLLGEEV